MSYNFITLCNNQKTEKMSEENKDLGDKAEDAFNNAKETAKDIADKAGEKASELKDDAKEVFEDTKEKASDFAEDAKEATKEFVDDAKEVLSDNKTIAIIAHLTIIGWIIALVMNNNEKTELGSFYIRQVLGIILIGLLSLIPILGIFVGIFCLVLWVVSLVGALGGTKKPVFLFGEQFQEWFKSL